MQFMAGGNLAGLPATGPLSKVHNKFFFNSYKIKIPLTSFPSAGTFLCEKIDLTIRGSAAFL